MEADAKPWYASKSVIGALVALGAVVAGFFGIKVDPVTQAWIVDQTMALATSAGAVFGIAVAIYGRLVAKQPIA
jgi:hypothetical protein